MDVLTMRTRGRLGPNKPRRVSQNPQKKSPMVDRPPTDSPQDEVPANSVALSGITRRELFSRSGKIAVAAAVSSAFYPFTINVKAASVKTLSFWQFYAPTGQVGTQTKWFEDCVKAWNATHDVKVELQYVPVQDYMSGSKLQTAFASGQGPDIFIISPGDFLRYYNDGALVELTP